jgi:hypothetical protein
MAEIQSSRPWSAYRNTVRYKLTEKSKIEISMLPDVIGETRCEKASVQNFVSGDRDSIPVKKRPFPGFRLKKFIEQRIIDDP